MNRPRTLRRWRRAPDVAAAAALAGFVALGFWQLDRAAHQQARLDAFAASGGRATIEIDAGAVRRWAGGLDAEALRYRPVHLRGEPLADRQYLLDNRTRHGVAGYHVLTPVRVGRTSAVLVDRGWIALGRSRDRLPDVSIARGSREFSGLLSPALGEVPVLGDTGYRGEGWPRVVQRVEYATVSEQLGLQVPAAVVLMAPAEPGGFVREWAPGRYLTPARHRGYAVQWFALAATVVVVYLGVSLRGRRR